MELIQNVADIFGNGAFVDVQFGGNLLVAQTACDQAQGFLFALGQRIDFGGLIARGLPERPPE